MSDAPAPTRPTAWFLARGTRVFGPLAREELLAYFQAGMVAAGDTVSGPEWDGALPVAEARVRLGVAAAVSPDAPAASLPPLRPAPLDYVPAGPGWRVVALGLVAMAMVQFFLIPSHSLGGTHSLGEFVIAAASRFVAIAAACFTIVGLASRALRGRWPSARGPLLAMAAVYVVLVGQRLATPEAVQVAPVAVAEAPARPDDVPPTRETQAFALEADLPDGAMGPDPAAVDALWSEVERKQKASAAPSASPRPETTEEGAALAPSAREIAHRLYVARDWNALLAHAQAWTGESPDDWAAWTCLAIAQHHLGRREEAFGGFARAYALAPDEPLVARNFGDALAATRDYARAAQVLEPLVQRLPDDYDARIDYGHSMSMLGEYDEAVAALDQATRLQPDRQEPWATLGGAHQRAGYPDRARAAYEQANKASRP